MSGWGVRARERAIEGDEYFREFYVTARRFRGRSSSVSGEEEGGEEVET